MSAPEFSAYTAIAIQFAAAVEAYDVDVDELVSSRLDPDTYRRVSRQLDTMRLYAAAVPGLSVFWVELLLRHFELTHCLLEQHRGEAGEREIAVLRERQHMAALHLRSQCLQLIGEPGQVQ